MARRLLLGEPPLADALSDADFDSTRQRPLRQEQPLELVPPELCRLVHQTITVRDGWYSAVIRLVAGAGAGCGACPDLSIPPAIKRDATALKLAPKEKPV